MKKIILLGMCLAVIAVTAGCGTIKGVGEDIGAVGGWLTRGSDRAQE